jgi:hypothetical protein
MLIAMLVIWRRVLQTVHALSTGLGSEDLHHKQQLRIAGHPRAAGVLALALGGVRVERGCAR